MVLLFLLRWFCIVFRTVKVCFSLNNCNTYNCIPFRVSSKLDVVKVFDNKGASNKSLKESLKDYRITTSKSKVLHTKVVKRYKHDLLKTFYI